MVSCTKCQTANSLDSAFCKHCGSAIEPEAAAAGRMALGKRIADGLTLFDSGHVDEAEVVATEVIAADPESLRGMTLRALVLDRRGRQAEALALIDRILEAEPDNPADLARIHQLRARLLDPQPPTPAGKRVAIFAAVSACVLVVAVGSLAATLAAGRQTPTVAKKDATPDVMQTPFTANDGVEQPSAQQAPANAGIGQDGQPQDPVEEPVQKQEPELPEASATLPKPDNGLGGSVTPVSPLPKGIEIRPETPPKSAEQDPEPSAVKAQPLEPQPEKPVQSPPIVDIRLSEAPKKVDAPMNPNGIEALVRTARGQYQVGNYQAAAATYERALQAGAEAGATNQRLAQCYEQLGRRSDAIEAYQRSVTAFERSVAAGKGGERSQAALDAARQALKNLQGA